MKKSLLSLLPLLGMLAVSCSDNAPFDDSDNNFVFSGESTTGYLSVSLVSPLGIGSRDGEPSTTPSNGTYVNGTQDESKVSSVRFYFFDNDGKPAPVRKNPTAENQYYSYFDWTASDADKGAGDADKTIESIMSTTLLLDLPEDAQSNVQKPAKVVAVVNPSPSVLALGNVSLDQLDAAGASQVETSQSLSGHVSDFLTSLTTSGKFVMSNSVHTTDYTAKTHYESILDAHIKSSPDEAKNNQLKIFVERVIARLDLAIDETKLSPKTDETGVYNINFKFAEKPVYVKFLGWTVVSTPNKSNLLKDIDPTWDKDMWGTGLPWNISDLKRSFWAYNPEGMEEEADENGIPTAYNWFSYNEIKEMNQITSENTKSGNTLKLGQAYMHENANPKASATKAGATASHPTYPSKVVVAAQLVDADGKGVTICEYKTNYYNITDLKTAVANYVKLYRKDDSGQYTQITANDLDFTTTPTNVANYVDGPDKVDGYYVYFTLAAGAKDEKWYYEPDNSSTTSDWPEVAANKIDKFIYDCANRAMIWSEGQTYYFFDIKHLLSSTDAGSVGVVRNHIYDSTINELKGLGTPVYDPNSKIYPVKPDDSTGNMISAQVNILQWRVVTNQYEFSW
ncbi:MAG: Mfa1 fimbrilin C-terminal domain-containing protein [Muribaculaceae bacterium]|nr:Mfa1 fimbrilin C-terminal domain-containing protein [Muribaculaceae bacterium]